MKQKRIAVIGSASVGLVSTAILLASAYSVVAVAPGTEPRPLQLTAESKNGKAHIRIVGRIANWNENNSNQFQRRIDELLKTHTEADVYINSMGGDVFEAIEMNNVLKGFEKVTVTVGALAASSGTYFTSSYYTRVYNTTQIMIHKPSVGGGGNEDELANKLKLVKNATKKFVDLYVKKTGKTKEEIHALLNSGDYWMSAEEALAEGFIDEIIKEDGKVSAEDVSILEACGAPIVPKATAKPQKQKPKQKQIMNREELIAFLGLDAEATDAQITAAQNKMKVDAAKQRQAEQDAKTAETTAVTEKANTLVDAAIVAKKIKADQKQAFLDLATANFDSTKTILDAMVARPKLTDELNGDAGDTGASEASRDAWTLEDYLEKAPADYEKMLTENPKQAKALEAAYFGN